ncbi:hypothetical protein ACRAWF_39605 [Streptomyces sp. L7]
MIHTGVEFDGEDFLLAVEAQERRDDRKEQSWAYYVAYLQSKYKLPVLLLVVCRDRATAKWAAGPFDCGTRGWTVQRTCPLVVGPDNLPMITDVRSAAKNPAMAAFSALTHANSPECATPYWTHWTTPSAAWTPTPPTTSTNFSTSLWGTPPPETNGGASWVSVNYFPGRGHLMGEGLSRRSGRRRSRR